jgi:hypothetical protein
MKLADPVSVDPTLPPSRPAIVLGLLTEARVNGWSRELTADILREGVALYKPLAKRLGFAPEELMSLLWEFWQDAVPDDALLDNTAAFIYRTLAREASAQVRLTSVEGTRRVGAKDFLVVAIPANDADVPTVGSAGEDDEELPLSSTGTIAVRHILIAAGLDEDAATGLVEAVVDQLVTSSSLQGAIKQLGKDGAMAGRLGLSLAQWRAIVGLVLGTPRGQPGLYELVSRGHPNPRRLNYVKRQIARLLEHDSTN